MTITTWVTIRIVYLLVKCLNSPCDMTLNIVHCEAYAVNPLIVHQIRSTDYRVSNVLTE